MSRIVALLLIASGFLYLGHALNLADLAAGTLLLLGFVCLLMVGSAYLRGARTGASPHRAACRVLRAICAMMGRGRQARQSGGRRFDKERLAAGVERCEARLEPSSFLRPPSLLLHTPWPSSPRSSDEGVGRSDDIRHSSRHSHSMTGEGSHEGGGDGAEAFVDIELDSPSARRGVRRPTRI